MPEGISRQFLVQWHLTARCDQRCKHCYVYDNETYLSELSHELSYDECLRIIDDIDITIRQNFRRELRINFSGGDPLLCQHFWKILTEAEKRKIQVGILGNPHHITKQVAENLYQLGIESFQVSLDGMEQTHDMIRGRGSFAITVQGIRLLKAVGIPVTVMFTLSRLNTNDILAVVKLCSEEAVNIFAFDSLIPVGNSEHLKELVVTVREIRRIMYQYRELKRELVENGSRTLLREKGNLWTLIDSEMGLETDLLHKSKTSKKICAGCPIGISTVSILADGTVYPCRRLPIKIGKFPKQTLWEVFFGQEMQQLRQEHKIRQCGICELFNVCRGCRALAYAMNGDYFAPDPHCWKYLSEGEKMVKPLERR